MSERDKITQGENDTERDTQRQRKFDKEEIRMESLKEKKSC